MGDGAAKVAQDGGEGKGPQVAVALIGTPSPHARFCLPHVWVGSEFLLHLIGREG